MGAMGKQVEQRPVRQRLKIGVEWAREQPAEK
jgi:hypothetical protein